VARLVIVIEAVVDERFASLGGTRIDEHVADLMTDVEQLVKGEDYASLLPTVEITYTVDENPPQKGSV
jgi:hypothetical protein